MSQTIFITGSTDGIGALTAKMLAKQGHKVLLHGRNAAKLEAVAADIGADTERYVADLTHMSEVENMATRIRDRHDHLDVLINNAGVLKTAHPRTPTGLDIRFVVNALAPVVLTRRLRPIIPKTGRVVNLSSAAQARVDVNAMAGRMALGDMDAYAQSKLALTIWSQEQARALPDGPVFVAVNPGSLLASKMVREGFGVAGKDLAIGANILCAAALDASFADASGQYFDNDSGRFAPPHDAAQDARHVRDVMRAMDQIIAGL